MFHFQRKICKKCREERRRLFPKIVESEKIDGEFSPFFEGFSNLESEKLGRFDCLIVSESVGNLRHHIEKMKEGKSPSDFLKDYYLKDKLETFNQQEIRKLLSAISKKRLTFYFTDVIKCFVKKEKDNFELALEYCANYLKKQFEILKPKIVILLGREVERIVFKKILNKKGNINRKLTHGEVFTINGMKIIYSEFPSARNSDRFVKSGGVDKLIKRISK